MFPRHLAVWNPEDLVSFAVQHVVPFRIARSLVGIAVHSTVYLQYQTELVAVEINHESQQEMLAPEFEPK